MLTLPYACCQMGLLGGMLLQLASSVAAGYSLFMLVASARRTGATTYGSVAADAFGPEAAPVVTALTFVLTFMCITAYSVILRDLIGSGIEFMRENDRTTTDGTTTDDTALALAAAAAAKSAASKSANTVLLLLLLAVAFPLSLHKSLSGLRFVTPASLGSMLLLACAVTLRGSMHAYTQWEDIKWRLWPRDGMVLLGVLKALPIYTLSYMCHFNALSMHAELTNPTRERLKLVIAIVIAVSTTAYTLFGLAGYLWAGDDTQGDVLQNFPFDDPLVSLGRVGLGIGMLCNIPLMVLPARDILADALSSWSQRCSSAGALTAGAHKEEAHLVEGSEEEEEGVQMQARSKEKDAALPLSSYGGTSHATLPPPAAASPASGDYTQPLAPAPEPKPFLEDGWLTHGGLTLLILLGAFCAATACPGVEVVWGLCGSSVGILLALTFPSAIYLKLRFHKGFKKMASTAVLLVTSLALLVACSWASMVASN